MDEKPQERPAPDLDTVRKELDERDREIEESEPEGDDEED
jgi:hypothetical protein